MKSGEARYPVCVACCSSPLKTHGAQTCMDEWAIVVVLLGLIRQGIVHVASGARDGSRALGRRRRLLEEQETREGSMESAVMSQAATALKDASSVFKPHIDGFTFRP